MIGTHPVDSGENSLPGEKVLLALLPFWDPQIPPLGAACLKNYLQQYNYNVKAADANLELDFREINDAYFRLLRKYIPGNKRGNLYNIGNQVLRNHLMAHLNYTDENEYVKLVEILLLKTFYYHIDDSLIFQLNKVIGEFYTMLEKYVIDLLEKEKPTVLGLSVYGDTLPASLAAFRTAKRMFPSIKTVMGGGIFADQLAPGSPNLDYFVEKTKDYIDRIIIGEGEILFLKCIRGELDESQRVFGLKDIDEETLSMSSYNVPDFSDFDLRHYPHLAHYGSRSCLFQCRFCSETIQWGKYRKKPMEQLVKELIELNRRHSYQLFLLTDSLLNPIANGLAAEVLKAKVPLYWDGFLRADKPVCKIENTAFWRKGGFYRAKLGIESGSQKVLGLMGKQITVKQIEEALFSLAQAGIKTTTFWLFGYPGETEEDFQQTLKLIENMKDFIYEADCNPFNYYLTGQANSQEWQKNGKARLLYPARAKDMLITQTWVLEGEPSREEAFSRVNRFVEHIDKLGIPNPYSLSDIFNADDRWKKLHKNAVPPLVELKNKDIRIDESKNVKKLSFARDTFQDDDDWF